MINKFKSVLNYLTWLKAEESDTKLSDELSLASDTRNPIRLGFWLVGIGFGGFLLWASLAPLDEGATSMGTVTVDSRRKTIQHQTGGIVEEILVKEGQAVKAGQILIKLLQTNSLSNLKIYQIQAAEYKKKLDALKPLLNEGYYPQLQFDELKRQYEEVTLKVNMAKEELERTEIKSPIDGVVMGNTVTTIGGVITSGSKIMDIVPEGDGLVIEAKIMPQLIDRIHAGLEAHVRFSALNQRTTPVVGGVVEWVSPDKFTDPSTMDRMLMAGYYTAKIRLSSDALSHLGGQQLYPGMPADVIIKTGRRTFMSYLIKPFTDRAALSLKER